MQYQKQMRQQNRFADAAETLDAVLGDDPDNPAHANLRAAEDMIARTDTPHAPWVVVSADDKRYARVATLKAVCRALSDRLD